MVLTTFTLLNKISDIELPIRPIHELCCKQRKEFSWDPNVNHFPVCKLSSKDCNDNVIAIFIHASTYSIVSMYISKAVVGLDKEIALTSFPRTDSSYTSTTFPMVMTFLKIACQI